MRTHRLCAVRAVVNAVITFWRPLYSDDLADLFSSSFLDSPITNNNIKGIAGKIREARCKREMALTAKEARRSKKTDIIKQAKVRRLIDNPPDDLPTDERQIIREIKFLKHLESTIWQLPSVKETRRSASK